MTETLRLDKWLWFARFVKSRADAQKLIERGQVTLNSRIVQKTSAAVRLGDTVAIVIASIMALVAGVLGAELFISRLSLLGALVGSILFLEGWRRLHVLLFPLAFLLLMIPLPAIIFNQIAFPLQITASRVGELAMTPSDLARWDISVIDHTVLQPASYHSQQTSTLLANGTSTSSRTGRPSMSERSATTGPGRPPLRIATTPLRATPVLASSR